MNPKDDNVDFSTSGFSTFGSTKQPREESYVVNPANLPKSMTKEEFEQLMPSIDLGAQIEEAQKRKGGYKSEENEAMWSSMAARQAAQQQAAQRALATKQAQMGVRGGAGAAQLGRQQQQFAAQKAMASQELGIKNIDEQTRRIAEYNKLNQQQQMADAAKAAVYLQIQEAEKDRQAQAEIARVTAESQKVAAKEKGGCCLGIAAICTSSSLASNNVQAHQFAEATKVLNQQQLVSVYGQKAIPALQKLTELRFVRDHVCSQEERRGYYIFSESIGEKLVQFKPISAIGMTVVVNPLAELSKPNQSWIKATIGKIWIKIFGVMASKEPFTRKNGEVV